MKVSDLIKVLEEHKDKEFYHLNVGNPIQIQNIKTHIVGDVLFLEINGNHDFMYICEMESLDHGFTPRMRTESEMDLYKIQKKRDERNFNYYFEVGTEVMIDEEVLFDIHKEQLAHLLGKKGVVKKCESNFHAYGQGKSYAHVVEWENGYKTQDTDWNGANEEVEYDENFVPKNYLPTIYLIKFKDDTKD
jgi:hypothetical protein